MQPSRNMQELRAHLGSNCLLKPLVQKTAGKRAGRDPDMQRGTRESAMEQALGTMLQHRLA